MVANIVNIAKCTCKTLFKTSAGKTAGKFIQAPKPRLFSIRTNPAIGTEIRNNITGTSYLRKPGVASRNIEVAPSVTIHRADGTYSVMSTSKFDRLLTSLRRDPEAWNPVIKSDPHIGKELTTKTPWGEINYFRSVEPIDGQVIKKIEKGHYQSMRLEEFDDMILNLLG